MLHDRYLKDVKPDEHEMLTNGFEDPFDATVSIIDGKSVDVKRKDSSDIIPGYKKKRGEQHIFYFLPLHIDQYDYGYTIYRDDARIMDEASRIFNYLEKIEQAIKMLRINLRIGYLNKELTLLYDTDQMTGLYNRFGFVKNGVPLFERCKNIGEPMTIMFVDINSMKLINDQYGHLQGDNAIRTVAQSIQAGIPGDWFAIRYGGDEFLIIGSDENGESAAEIKKTVTENIRRNSKKAKLPYKLTASVGYVITDPKDSLSLEDYIKLADNMMYEIKRKLHAKENKAKEDKA
jgi:diguanylate cyclase (GGDEF)-like protein